jgi:protein-tyrosine phosphatase
MRWWFITIGASTLLVWQHHLMDVVTGFLMAYAIVVLFPDRETQPGPAGWIGKGSMDTARLARRYGLGALVCTAAALPGHGWLWFGWPAIALGLTATGYATANPRWFQKASGTPSPAAEWILLPATVLTRLFQVRWLRAQPAWREVTPGVFFGRRLSEKEAATFLLQHLNLMVIDLTSESKETTAFRERARYVALPVLDLTVPDAATLARACEIIREQLPQGPVFIHCLLGLGRSAYVAAAWLLDSGQSATPAEAVLAIRAVEPRAVLRPEALKVSAEQAVVPNVAK